MKLTCKDCGRPTFVDHVATPGARVLAKCDRCKRREEKASRLALAAYYEGSTLYVAAGRTVPKGDA